MNKTRQFKSTMASALADRKTARDELFAWLQGLPPEERAKVPPEKFSRLTSEQFAMLLGRCAPEKANEAANSGHEAARDTPLNWQMGRRAGLYGTSAMNICSPFYRALKLASVIGLCTGLVSIATVYLAPYAARLAPPPIRQANAARWPQCSRLTPSTDGCVYQVEKTMTWSHAAKMLAMPRATLLHANNTAGVSPLVKGALITVWRFRRTLSN